jgi:hypothetical protein
LQIAAAGVRIGHMRSIIGVALQLAAMLTLLCACRPKPFDVIAEAQHAGLKSPLYKTQKETVDFFARHPDAARRIEKGCDTAEYRFRDPRHDLCLSITVGEIVSPEVMRIDELLKRNPARP